MPDQFRSVEGGVPGLGSRTLREGQKRKMNINVAPALVQNAGRRGFVTGHDFSRAEDASENGLGFSPCRICFQPTALEQRLKPKFDRGGNRHD